MGQRARNIFVGIILISLCYFSFLMFSIQSENVMKAFATFLLFLISFVLFFLITFGIYISRRKKYKIIVPISQNFLDILSNEGENMYVYKKFCQGECICMFQYLTENGDKIFIAKSLAYINIQKLENFEKPYIEKVHNTYIPKKGNLCDYLFYSKSIEEKNKERYILHVNEDMIFCDTI